ncbi:MAG: YkgJ family cysteine cluster protein [Proteobacteria bacterium]|nr:YkgJ family cysteine cluster protein [Pseudomonadota bacterium]MBI3497760.1 YkgJ family cysteine cluster protein [Pseudomonadota bacterium]
MSEPSEQRVSLEPFFVELGRSLSAATADALQARPNPGQLRVTVDAAMGAFEDAVAGLEKWSGPERKLDCREGCTHCCRLTVLADGATVIRIALYIEENFGAERRSRLMQRIAERQALHAGLEQAERQLRRDPCPLLEDGRCSVYPVRPMICRSFNSMNVATCEREILGGGNPEGIDAWRIPWLVGLAVNEGLMTGLVEAGYVDGDVELVAGLAIALGQPNTAERWLAHEPSLAPAQWRIAPADDPEDPA